MTRFCIISDHHLSAAGNVSWVKQFIDLMKDKDDIVFDVITEKDLDPEHKLYDYCPQSSINVQDNFNNIKTPCEVLVNLGFVTRRLYEQMRTKVYDAFIVQRLDYLPVLQSLNLMSKVPIWTIGHDVSIHDGILNNNIKGSCESPYRMLEMEKSFLSTEGLNIGVYSDLLGNQLKNFNNKLNIRTLPVAINDKIVNSNSLPFEATNGVLWVGSGVSYKNPSMFFEIVKANPDIQFYGVFNTKSKAVFTKLKKKYEADNLMMYSNMPLEELIELYQKTRFGIVTSEVETFCIAAQEHLMFHPCFFSTKNVNNYQKVFQEGMEFNSVKHFNELIKEKYNDQDFYNEKVNAGRDFIITNYNRDLVKSIYDQFIEDLRLDLISKNKFRDYTTMGQYLKMKLACLKEVEYNDILRGLNYNDYIIAQHSIYSQMVNFKKIDYKDKTCFQRLEVIT